MDTKKSPIFSGIMLIGLGILAFTGWWWPGIMLVIGTALGVDKIMQGKVKEAIGLFLLFLAIPAAVFIFSNSIISPTIFVPVLLVGIGFLVIARSLLNKAQS
jgi:hypothetical protein